MADLKEMVRDVIEELDPDGAGFRTSEAADLLYHRLMQGCTVNPQAEQAHAHGRFGGLGPERQVDLLRALESLTELQPGAADDQAMPCRHSGRRGSPTRRAPRRFAAAPRTAEEHLLDRAFQELALRPRARFPRYRKVRCCLACHASGLSSSSGAAMT